MTVRSWIQMPVWDSTTPGGRLRPRHAIEGNALLVYRGEKVYAAPEEPGVLDRIAQLPDVRRLTRDEAANFETTLPGGGSPGSHGHVPPGPTALVQPSGRVGLGDAVSWLTSTLGMHECGACRERKKRLNRIAIWRSREMRREG